MIVINHSWRCTLCNHGRSYFPEFSNAPDVCPACNDGKPWNPSLSPLAYINDTGEYTEKQEKGEDNNEDKS